MAEHNKITIDPEFQALIPPLDPVERAGLEESILREGCRDPLVVWRNGQDVLLDGHNRLEICQAHGIAFETTTIELPSREHAKLWILRNQLHRRNLTDDQRAAIAHRVLEAAAALSRSGRAFKAAVSRWGKAGCSVADVATKHKDKPRLRTEAAEAAHIKDWKLKKMAQVAKRGGRDVVEAIARGDLGLSTAHARIVRAEIVQSLTSKEVMQAKELAGLFDVIVIDPPWPLYKLQVRDRPDQVFWDYPVMSVDEIDAAVGTKLARHAAENCWVFFWTVQRYEDEARDLLKKWGLTRVYTGVWHKDGGYQPWIFGLPKYNHEIFFCARKGSPKFIDMKDFNTCFYAKRAGHSEKPEEFYALLRRVTAGRRLDLFNRRAIEGFEGWGKEAPEAKTSEDAA